QPYLAMASRWSNGLATPPSCRVSLVRADLDRGRPAPVPRRELVDELVIGQVEVDRRHADLSVAHRRDIGPRLCVARDGWAANPVIRFAVRVEPLDELGPVVALAEPGDFHPGDSVARKVA